MKKLFLLLAVIIATSLSAVAQSQTVKGVVVDADTDEPLVGASVLPVGSTSGVATDLDGQFTLSVPATVKQLTVSYMGYTSKTVAISSEMKIALSPSSTMLDQVVVTGYGSGKKLGSVVGSVAVVGDAVLENTPATTFVDALQGQVPGLAIYSNSGDPSSVNNSIYLRGINSLSASNTPLYILDGSPVDASMFLTLNPSNIKSVTVLKDASSVAIYGARAANGVIVITTKNGAFGEEAKVNIRASIGWSQMVGDRVDMMNSEQYIKYRELIGSPVNEDLVNIVNTYNISTDWVKEFFKSSAPTYSIEASVSGGSERLSYFLALSHYDQEGIITNSDLRRETLQWSLESKVSNWFRLGFKGNLGFTKYQTNGVSDELYNGGDLFLTNPMVSARMALPFDAPNYYTIDDDGNIEWGEKALYLHYTGMYVPDYEYAHLNESKNRLTINTGINETITPITGLTLQARQNVEAYDYRYDRRGTPFLNYYTPMGDRIGSATNPETGRWEEGLTKVGYVQQNFTRFYRFTYTNTAEYKFDIAEQNHFGVLIGQESIISKTHGFLGFDSGHSDARLMLLGQGLQTTYDLSESMSKTVFNSFFGSINYDFDNRYFLQVDYRRDGSSKFAPKHRWANFAAVGVMWNMKKEKFLQPYSWLDDLRLRYSFGSTGNSGISDYMFQGIVGAGSEYAGANSTVLGTPGNKDLTWETVYQHDLGLTFGLFNRLDGTIDFYNKETKNMLMAIPYSYTTGIASAWDNVCSMRNRGFEIELNGDIYKSRDWYVGARVGFAYNDNEITKLFDGRDYFDLEGYGMRYEVGHNANEFYAVRYVGVDPRDGKQVWLDKNGNETKVYNADDKVMIGKTSMAPWTGGFGINARWKGLSLSANFNWAADKYMMNNDAYFIKNNQFGTSYNQTVDMLNVWTHPGQVTDIPAVTETVQKAGDDTRVLENASFVRLKNVTLQYSLPENWLNAVGLNEVTFHFTGRNLLTFTGFSGYDPEPQSNYVQFQYPNTRQYEFGVEVSF